MSQALFEQVAHGRHEARSAGTTPAEHVHPVVVTAMRELGVDLSERKPQLLTPELGQWMDVIVTMGCGDECPVIPGKRFIDWELPDPKDLTLDEVRKIREDIVNRVKDLSESL